MAKYAISPEGIRALKKLSSDILIVCNNLMDCSTKLQSSLVDLENDLGIYHVLINDIAMSNKSLLLKNKEDFEDLAARVCNQADELNSLLNFGDVGFVENTNNASQNSEGRVSVTVPITGKAQYESINDIPEKYYSLIRKYNADSGSFNDVIRAGKTTKDVKQMKKMIDKHSLFEDKQLYRNASVADFSSLGISEVTPQNLVGKKVVFSGFLSTTPNIKLANDVSHCQVLIEFKAPKGIHALDLSKTHFQEVIFNDKCEYVIDQAWNEGNGMLRVRARIIS